MASNYPSGLDSFTNPAGTDNLAAGIGHAAQHANANDAIEAIESTLGLNPQGASATVKARLDAIEADSWVTSARILDGTIVNGDVSASAAIDPSKVAQNVVTFSNADAVVATSTRKLVQIGTMSASRTVTLPAASGVPAGTELVVADLSGSVTTTNTIVVSRAGSDTVNGATSTTIGAAYGWRRFVSDGSSKWVFDGGVHRTSDTGTVTSTNILDGTIATADLADGAITPIKTSGGYVAKTALYTATNDDRIIDCTTGTYTITLPTAASQTGRRFVIRNSGTGTITIGRTGAETIAGATSQTLAGYGHLEVISNGTNWLVLRGTYSDETIGRRIFTWNSAYSSGSGGWQMSYGDSGWRDVSANINSGNGFTGGSVYIRRTGYNIAIAAFGLTRAAGGAGDFYTFPSGFQAALPVYGRSFSNNAWYVNGASSYINMAGTSDSGAGCMFGTFDAWPASLPGSASGSIPLA